MIQGNERMILFWSKIHTLFVSYVYDPVQGITETATFSDSANRRYSTQHAFAIRPANVPPGRCKRNLYDSSRIPG